MPRTGRIIEPRGPRFGDTGQTGGVEIELLRADVGPDESWAAAADRLADKLLPAGHGPVLAQDLSGDPLRFNVPDAGQHLALRPMTEGDFPDLTRWVNAPHVAQWWDDNRRLEQVVAYYGPGVRGEDPTRYWIWEVNGRSVGFTQDYRIADHPEFALLCGHPEAVGFDYAIGEPAFIDRGMGTALLWVFLRDIVIPAYPDATELFAAPHHRNTRSLRVLDKLGAKRGLWFDEPQPGGRVDTVVGCSIDVARVLASPALGIPVSP